MMYVYQSNIKRMNSPEIKMIKVNRKAGDSFDF